MSNFWSIFLSVLTLIGSLGVFLFGMKMLSEGLQKVAGNRMREMLQAMTSNRFKRIMTGVLVTAAIQSSSATTVMVVSFVNAGLLSLVQAVGVVMGANIGTTATAWIISLLGFKFNVSTLAIPLIGISVPLIFSKHDRRRSIGELMVGFALLFLGLSYLKESVPNLKDHQEILAVLQGYSDMGIWSVLLFVGIGTLMTIIVQSSSATMAITLVMCTNGWIGFTMAAAMILGENIGTTITANLAAAVGNNAAKRAAFSHFLFNIIGVIWVLIVFSPFLRLIDHITSHIGYDSPFKEVGSIPIALSLFHTCFNVTNTLLLVWFTPQLVRLVERIIPNNKESEDEFRLRYIGLGLMSTGELSLEQARLETITYASRTYRMFGMVRSMMEIKSDRELKKTYERIQKYEDISDRMEVEIADYLSQVQNTDLSGEGHRLQQSLLKIINDIESIADHCYSVAELIKAKHSEDSWFSEYMVKNIEKMFDLVDDAFDVMQRNLKGNFHDLDLDPAYDCEDKINDMRDALRSDHLQNIEDSNYSYQSGVIYGDLIGHCERMGDSIINISEDIAETERQVKGLHSELNVVPD